MRPAYVRVELGDLETQGPTFFVSPVPFACHYGESLTPTKAVQRKASSYDEICAILEKDFHIPNSLIPPAKYFRPTRTEKEEQYWDIYRTVPEGAGEPEWRIKARQALIELLEQAWFSSEKGVMSINGRHCYSVEELEEELAVVAEEAGGRKQIKGEAYQPDYDLLAKDILKRFTDLVCYVRLPKKRKRAK